jgi:hypothetical protein
MRKLICGRGDRRRIGGRRNGALGGQGRERIGVER